MMKRILVLTKLILISNIIGVFAQEEETVLIEELLFDQLSEEVNEGADHSEFMEKLNYYFKHPMDLNKVTASDLSNLIFLSPQQIDNILYHRVTSGDFVSTLELQGIEGLTPQLINLLRHFVFVGEQSPFKKLTVANILKYDESMLMIRYGRTLEQQKGYTIKDENRSRYLGDPNKYAIRYRWNYDNKIRIAINMEKDAGEPFFKEKQRNGFDYYAGYLEFNSVNKYVKKLVIGDYALQFGQGLISWNGLSFGKGAWVGSVAKQGTGLRGYSSMNENNFQRGVSSLILLGAIEWVPFIAYNRLSGKIIRSDSIENQITTISKTGLHRTPTEQSYRNAIKQWVYGSHLNYKYKRLRLGITYMHIKFDGNVVKGQAKRNAYDFEGTNLEQLGISYQNTYRNLYFFGESAYSFNGAFATINGVIASVTPKVSMFASYRNYAKSYHSFYAQTLSESSSVGNESGIYSGISFHPNRKIEWNNYIDVFQHPWLKYRVDDASSGADYFSQFAYIWYKKGKITGRYRYRWKQENLLLPKSKKNILTNVVKQQFRLDFQYKLDERWTIRSRAEVSLFVKEHSNKSNGTLYYQDVFWKGLRKLDLNMRLAYFDTDDYDSRIYAYENDVLYASSFPVYYDKGFRTYLNIRWRLTRQLDMWSRYALSYFSKRETIGSGLDEIKGKIRSELKLQLRWEW